MGSTERLAALLCEAGLLTRRSAIPADRFWQFKGWRGALRSETLVVDTQTERSIFTPFTKPDCSQSFETDPERVMIETLETDDEEHDERVI
jgi:hypothetical protein